MGARQRRALASERLLNSLACARPFCTSAYSASCAARSSSRRESFSARSAVTTLAREDDPPEADPSGACPAAPGPCCCCPSAGWTLCRTNFRVAAACEGPMGPADGSTGGATTRGVAWADCAVPLVPPSASGGGAAMRILNERAVGDG